MVGMFMRALFGTKGERDIKRLAPVVARTTQLEAGLQAKSDDELRAETPRLKAKLARILGEDPRTIPLRGEGNEANRRKLLAALDEILPEAFAAVRETARRTVKQRHYDVQLIGGMVLHQGKIAEMKTGEGKTLAATLPVYLNALVGRGVHVVTVNDYLARRDAEWMGPIYRFLGMTVGWILTSMDHEERQASYACDITYGTNNEFGFDYLRDNMVMRKEHKVQRDFYFCIVDEVDSILIDEARTPLIISGPAEESTKKYQEIQQIIPRLKRGWTIGQDLDNRINELVGERTRLHGEADKAKSKEEEERIEAKLEEVRARLKEANKEKQNATINKQLNTPLEVGDYIVEEKDRSVYLTPEGIKQVEHLLKLENLYSGKNIEIIHHVEQALRANALFKVDVDYVVKDGEVLIVDEFTGRLMPGRRYSDGLHQALEAKERVHVERENQTLATITFQNYFRMYPKLSGMTGTADTEAEEFRKIYKLDVVVIPTNRKQVRIDHGDKIYRTEKEKFQAIVEELETLHKKGQPVLVGTISVEKSEHLSRLLKHRGVPHNVLNAKFHEQEAEIVAQAGQPGKVTIATNMAGRGTDIILGGNAEMQSRMLLENLFKGAQKKPSSDEITDFVRLLVHGRRDDALAFMGKETPFTADHADKVQRVLDECKAQQAVVKDAGGLFILGTERHEARRIDNQLRGRSGRQGDPGGSRFYLSTDDDLMRLFGGERLKAWMQRFGLKEGEEIEHPLVSRSIATSQKKVENRNFEVRKHLLKYDEIMNDQRMYIYDLRDRILDGRELRDYMLRTVDDTVNRKMAEFAESRGAVTMTLLESMQRWIENDLRIRFDVSAMEGDASRMDFADLKEDLAKGLKAVYEERERTLGPETMREIERLVLLNTLDAKWKEHLYEMDMVKEGISWRSYAEKDPLVEFKYEGSRLFRETLENMDDESLSVIFHAELAPAPEMLPADFFQGSAQHDAMGQFGVFGGLPQAGPPPEMAMAGGPPQGFPGQLPGPGPGPRRQAVKQDKVGRNDPCPCGSGKKYKLCHGR